MPVLTIDADEVDEAVRPWPGSEPMARRRRRAAAEQPPAAATTSPPRGGAYRPLSAGDCDAIVEHAFAILGEVGLADAPPSARDRLVARGAVERHDGRLTFPRPVVESAIERSPSRVDLPGFVEGRYAAVGTGFTIDAFGTPCPATRHNEAVYDPEHQRPRSRTLVARSQPWHGSRRFSLLRC